nr:Flp family type IVb pilin [uncultured Brevundimonas sp.]
MRRPSLSILKRLCRDDRGATAMEYGLIIALIALALIGTLTVIGVRIEAVMDRLTAALA